MASGADVAAGTVPDRGFRYRAFNRKVPAPSLDMHPSDGHRYRCPWLHDSITVHSDGNVTCGLDDPHGQRSFGNVNVQPVEAIFRNPEYGNLQGRLRAGHRCAGCSLYARETVGTAGAAAVRPALPTTLVVEPTVKCNIRCLNDVCHANNDASVRTRDADMLPYETFVHVVEQLKAGLRQVYFFNYGNPFVHARAEDMLVALRQACPAVEVITSTNGIPLAKPGRAEKVVQADPDTIVFTIGGITQESYARYHVGGKAEMALQGLRNVCEARRAAGDRRMKIVWRYLLFHWNDSVAEVDEAIRLANEMGVDGIHLYLTHVPAEGASFRFAPGTPNFARYRPFIDCALGYTRLAGVVEPGADGLFDEEEVDGLGPARWTGFRARLARDGRGGRVRLQLATRRPGERSATVFLRTPWGMAKRVLAPVRGWQAVDLAVPRAFRTEAVEVELLTGDHWFPAEEMESADKRCLGVLVRPERLTEGPGERGGVRRWLTGGREAGLSDEDRALLDGLGWKGVEGLADLPRGGRHWVEEG